MVTNNAINKYQHTITPITTQAVRLQMVQGEQEGYTTRVNEFAVYGHLQEQTAISAPASENPSANLIYDLQGRRVLSPTKGLYIINGHKVLIK